MEVFINMSQLNKKEPFTSEFRGGALFKAKA